jgi:hypothetical protein
MMTRGLFLFQYLCCYPGLSLWLCLGDLWYRCRHAWSGGGLEAVRCIQPWMLSTSEGVLYGVEVEESLEGIPRENGSMS